MKIAVASGKGGTGKTLVATNLFQAACNRGVSARLVDCDAEEPNVMEFFKGEAISSIPVNQNMPVINTELCAYCNACHEYCNYNAIICLPPVKYIRVVEELCHDCGACLAACRYRAISEKIKTLGEITVFDTGNASRIVEGRARVGVFSPVPVIKKSILQAGHDGLVILDSPPGISCPFIITADLSDFIILVTEPTPFGLNDLKLSVETLQKLKKPFGVIINRAGLGDMKIYSWLKEEKIELLAEIAFDREIARIYSEGKLLVEEKPHFQLKFSELLDTVIRKPCPAR